MVAMPTSIPDYRQTARREADALLARPAEHLYGSLDRVMKENKHLNRDDILHGTAAFHQERMQRRPSVATWPEAKAWVEYVLSVDAEVQKLTNLSDEAMALYRSLNSWLCFRGYVRGSEFQIEKCRVAYLPDTDRGTLHVKNVDDPATHWKRRPPITSFTWTGLQWDGTGSGLHIDDEPPELFPLPITPMCLANCNTVPEAIDFLTRYSVFFGRCNVLLYDDAKRSVAIEKCSFNHMQIHQPDRFGRSHISGMVCRDPESPIAKFQKAKRDQYRKLFNLPDNGSDAAYWNASTVAEAKLAKLLDAPAGVPARTIVDYFRTPRPAGLNKNGDQTHPDQPVLDFTLITQAFYLDERKVDRWQRSDTDLTWPTDPEHYDFAQ